MEVDVEAACRRNAKREGGHLIKFLPWITTGFPDRILLLPGAWIVFIEFKAPKKGLRPRQAYWRRILEGLGFRYAVVRTVEQFEWLLTQWKESHPY